MFKGTSISMLERCFERQFAGLSEQEKSWLGDQPGFVSTLPGSLCINMIPIWTVNNPGYELDLISVKYSTYGECKYV